MSVDRVRPELMQKAEMLLDLARRAGADEAQVTAQWSSSERVGFERSELHLMSTGEETSLGLRVHVDHRLGSASTNALDADDLARSVDAAMSVARFAPPDEYLCLPTPRPIAVDDRRWDPAVAALETGALRDLAVRYIESMRIDPRVCVDSGQVERTTSEACVLNSHGVSVADRETRLTWVGSGQAIDGDDITSFDYESGSSVRLAGVAERMVEDGRGFARHLLSTFGATPGPSYRGRVLLTPKVVGEMLLDPLCFQLSGLQVFYGKSSLGDDRIGQPICSPSISLIDDPGDLELGGACIHDCEGMPVARKAFITDGVLQLHMENSYSARRRGRELTGHGALNFHGASLAGGATPVAEILASPADLLVVHRFSGNVDNSSGDFSGIAKGSHLHTAGGNRRPVRETMIAGNVLEMLRCVVAVSRETEVVDATYRAPYLLVDGVSVTGD